MARGSRGGRPGNAVKGAELKPIRKVRRELTRPDGTTVKVEVPVYPPFRLEEPTEQRGREARAKRSAPAHRKRGAG